MKFPACVYGKQTAFLRIVLSIVTITPLWLMLTAVPTLTLAQSQASPADWTQFHRDNMQRWNPYETVLGIGNVGGLQFKWSYPNVGFLTSSPAVVNGVIYFGSGYLDSPGLVIALNASTGAKLWSFTTGSFVESSPAVVNGVVYIGSADGNLYALNATTSAKLWSFAAAGGVESSPAVVNGVVYFGSSEHEVYALNAGTGAKLWSYSTAGGSFPSVFSSPAVANEIVYVGAEDSAVYALNSSTGTLVWKYSIGSIVNSSPAVANGVVYIGSDDGNVYALNAGTGAKLWSYKTEFDVESSPAVANGVVYIGSFDNNLYALNASTGAKLWSHRNEGSGFSEWSSSPAVANGVVYVGSPDGNVYALNASTGAKLWSFATGFFGASSPSTVDGELYIRAGNNNTGGYVYAFSLEGTPADLFLRIWPSTTTVHQGDLLTYAFPVWNLGPNNAFHEVLNTQVPAGTVMDYIRISGTPGLGTCTHPPYGGIGQSICHEGDGMAPNTTWTVRLTVKVTAPAGTVITANAATMADTPDPNLANNTATASIKVQ